MVNLEPKSASVTLGDLSQQFDDILGSASSGPNTDGRGTNNNGGVESDGRVSSGQSRLSVIIIRTDENDTSDNRVINDISSGIRSDVFGNIHQEHVIDNRSSSSGGAVEAVYQGLNVTGEQQSLSRHHQEILHDNSISSPRTSSGLEIRAH